jgi:ATP-binding cassette subfamily B protein
MVMLETAKEKTFRPKISFSRVTQLFFTFREVTKIVAQINLSFLILIFVLNAVWGFSTIPGLYLDKLIIDRLVKNIGNPNWHAAIYVVGLLAAFRLILELVRSLLSNVNGFLSRSLARRFDAYLEVLMAKKLSELDLYTIEDPAFKNKFDKIERESGQRAWGLMMPLSNIPNYLVGFISSVVVLVFLHPLIALSIVVVSIPQFIVNSSFIKKNYELSTFLSPLWRLWGWLSYYLVRNKNYMELKILNLSGHLTEKLKETQKKVLDSSIDLAKKREMSNFGSYLPFLLLEFAVSVYLIFLVVIQKITIGSFNLYLGSLRSAQSNLSGLVSAILEIYENYIYVADLVWFLNLTPKIENQIASTNKKLTKDFSIEFKDVWFKYRAEQPWILKAINFKVNPGEKIALVGENGAGKSTLIKLLARFYDPQKGEITVGTSCLDKINLNAWRNRIGILFQEFETYPFSAHETIGYGDIVRVSDVGAIKDAAGKTGINQFVEDLPLKYENPLNPEFEGGVRPSIGQWQRLGISRMLFREKAKLIIMDEPTSSVDPEAEEKIFKELSRVAKEKILIFVTQRFSTVRIADRIFVMDKGRIIEQGTHRELMGLNGKYARLFNLQAKGYQ